MARLGSAIAAQVEVVARFGSDQADVLGLRLGALAHATRHRALDLVGSADAPVALLDPNREADRVLHSVPAPGGSDAALDRAQRLAVGMPAFEAGRDQLLPDIRELMHLGAEEIDALSAGDLGVKAVLLRDRSERDQLVGCDLAAGHPRHDAVEPAALHVGQEPVVGVLQGVVTGRRNALVPEGGENRRRRWLADLAAVTAAVVADQLFEGANAFDLDDLEQVLAGVLEVLAKIPLDRFPSSLELGVEQAGHERHATAAARAGGGAFLHGAEIGELPLADRRADLALRDVVARADLGAVREVARSGRRTLAADSDQLRGVGSELLPGSR